MSPRQRMINLMYIVLTAMLALNVSSDVLNGFSQVQESLEGTNLNMTAKNEVQFKYLHDLYEQNPAKAGVWYEKGVVLHDRSNALYMSIDSLKVEIAKKADGPQGDYHNIINNDDLEASAAVMLNPATRKGEKLRKRLEEYRDYVASLIPDPKKREAIVKMLNFDVKRVPGTVGPTSWEQKSFENMPAVAAVTMLTKIQNDMRQAESEAMSNLINSVDIGDIRVNSLDAYVIPNSNIVMRGGKYSARVVLAAIDTTQRPVAYVNGSRLPSSGLYEFVAGGSGTHQYSGYIEVPKPDGTIERRTFSSSYTVIEPMATISPTMMNVLYAGIDNPISISVPGVPMSAINASISSGSLVRSGDTWTARVSNVGQEATISVSASIEGRSQTVGSMKFRIRKLPDPTPYMNVGGAQYKGTPRRISKAALLGAEGLSAAVDDGILNIQYQVLSFTTVFYDSMGNAMPENSSGSHFSARQKERFKQLKPGKSFFISNIKAKGPDGIVRDISPMEVGLN
ncbi:MAG: gliding motility protein GldM [Clostridium sp.]|nr:gliding motility protein GldM [Prevotella sp.]MCM1429570.1 gliding motility protein GldM [Clostridium sp.]